MPVGFILDDVGRNRAEHWDALATEVVARPDVLLLGTLREEDMFLVAGRSLAMELREEPDSDLAERIWHELKDRGQTSWPGWREPWENCNGLTLGELRDRLAEQGMGVAVSTVALLQTRGTSAKQTSAIPPLLSIVPTLI